MKTRRAIPNSWPGARRCWRRWRDCPSTGALRRWPGRARNSRAWRRQHDGDAALTRALVALSAGTAEAARLEVRKARKLLGDTPQTLLLAAEADQVVCLQAPPDFGAVGAYYDDFNEVSDDEVAQALTAIA